MTAYWRGTSKKMVKGQMQKKKFWKVDPHARFSERWSQKTIRAVNLSEEFSCSLSLNVCVLIQFEIQTTSLLSLFLWLYSLYRVLAARNSVAPCFCQRLFHCCREIAVVEGFIRDVNLISVIKGPIFWCNPEHSNPLAVFDLDWSLPPG